MRNFAEVAATDNFGLGKFVLKHLVPVCGWVLFVTDKIKKYAGKYHLNGVLIKDRVCH